MTLRIRYLSVWLVLLVFVLTASTAAAATRVVDDDGEATASNCDSGTDTPYTTISQAITDANPLDKIVVCAGVYDEQLIIDKALTITGRGLVIIRPSPMVQNGASLLPSASPFAAVIKVTAPTGSVLLEQITVDGSENGITGCSPSVIGVLFQNASGTVRNSVVRNTYQGTGIGSELEGCQAGLGIFVQSADGLTSTVVVSGNSVHDYQKNGITGNETGTTLTVTNNTVTGWGPNEDIAQNGIQIGWGAGGTVKGNRVIDQIWTPCVSIEECAWSSTGILIFQAPTATTVAGNTVSNTQTGVYFEANGGFVTSNVIQHSRVWDGIFIWGNTNEVKINEVVDSDESGIWVAGDSNIVQKNTINEAPIGIVNDGVQVIPTTGTGKNIFYNVGVTVGPPPAAASLSAASSGGRVSSVR